MTEPEGKGSKNNPLTAADAPAILALAKARKHYAPEPQPPRPVAPETTYKPTRQRLRKLARQEAKARNKDDAK
jgi:hypothetical protein